MVMVLSRTLGQFRIRPGFDDGCGGVLGHCPAQCHTLVNTKACRRRPLQPSPDQVEPEFLLLNSDLGLGTTIQALLVIRRKYLFLSSMWYTPLRSINAWQAQGTTMRI